MKAVEIIFWTALAAVAYALLVYPVLAVLLAVAARRRARREPVEPTVSMIIAAYNEETAIGEKLEQTLALDYPRDRLEVIVASDGSSDRTDAIVQSFADRGVRLFRGPGRQGKTGTLNGAVAMATGEIVVFSDATGVFSRNSLRELASYFADPTVGCVTGRVAYRYGSDTTSRGFRAYQRFAVAVRRAESEWGSETSVSGSIHALRRTLYRPTNPAYSLDVINAVHAVASGQRVLYAYEAVSLEESRQRLADEFRCRVRIGVRATTMVPYILRTLLSAGRVGYLFQMISHKVLRWWLWFFLLVALASSGALAAWRGGLYGWLFAVQAAGYAIGTGATILEAKRVRVPGLSGLTLFVVGNAAMLVGAFKALVGQRMARWEPVR
ncbi:MAG: glycosyltransferase [Phycisphaerae bacterium]